MDLLDIFTGGTLGSAIGAFVGVGEKVVAQYWDLKAKKLEYSHVEKMHEMQFAQEQERAKNELVVAQLNADTQMMEGSFQHDSSIQNTAQWVSNIRALVRPASIALGFGFTVYDPATFFPLLSLMVAWYFASRVRPAYTG